MSIDEQLNQVDKRLNQVDEQLSQVDEWPVYSLTQAEKMPRFLAEIQRLSQHHQHQCAEYGRLSALMSKDDSAAHLTDFFPLPVRLFKSQSLKSVPDDQVIKTMTSSGTSGQQVSKIFLDKTTASLQVKILVKIMTQFMGSKRLPMLVIDCPSTVKDRLRFSARTTGILGFSMFGRDVTYALNDDMTLNHSAVSTFVERYQDTPTLIFGFTYIVWLHLLLTLEQLNARLSLPNGILIHGGGWKKLEGESVSKAEFKQRLYDATQISRVHNYYGMVEQTGSIFMECEQGHFHCSAWSELIVRDPHNLQPAPVGHSGLLQLFSVIPHSYPGHTILSEDIGHIIGQDDCPCGRKGTYFVVEGRMKQAEVRGCSDTYSK